MPEERPRWWQRSMLPSHLVTIVPEDELVSLADAREALGLRRGVVSSLVFVGDLERAATHPKPWSTDDIGVTAASLAREVEWWASASAAERRRRIRRLALRHGARSV